VVVLILKCDGRAEKAFTKWLPGMFPTPLLPLEEGAVLKGM